MAKRGGFGGGMPANMNNLMKQAQKMQKQMEETQKDLQEKEYAAYEQIYSFGDTIYLACLPDNGSNPLSLSPGEILFNFKIIS